MRAGPFRDFYRSTGGLVVVVLAGAMSVVGGLLIGRLSRDQVEQRVFGSAATIPMRDAP